MAIRVLGVPFGVTAKEWSVLSEDMHDAPSSMAVLSGLAVTSTGTRTVQVASGRCVQAGTRFSSDVATTLPQLATATTNARIDVVCAQVTWPASDQVDASDTAGAFVVVQGATGGPVVPALTQVAGQLWQTPLANVRVNTDGSMVITNVSAGSSVALTMPSGWSVPGASPLTVERVGSLVFLSGRLTRTAADLTAGGTPATFSGTAIIPDGFRPTRTASAFYTSDLADGSPTYGKLIIPTDGTFTLYQHTGTFASGQTVRVLNQSWIGA